MQNFSNPILTARTEAGKTQAEFAEILGISRNYLWMLESGRKPITPKMLAKINALDVPSTSQELLTQSPNQLDRLVAALERIADALEKLMARQETVK